MRPFLDRDRSKTIRRGGADSPDLNGSTGRRDITTSLYRLVYVPTLIEPKIQDTETLWRRRRGTLTQQLKVYSFPALECRYKPLCHNQQMKRILIHEDAEPLCRWSGHQRTHSESELFGVLDQRGLFFSLFFFFFFFSFFFFSPLLLVLST